MCLKTNFETTSKSIPKQISKLVLKTSCFSAEVDVLQDLRLASLLTSQLGQAFYFSAVIVAELSKLVVSNN